MSTRIRAWSRRFGPLAGFLVLAGALLLACGEPDHGPVAIHWDRDTCERCQMAISDPRFAVEVRARAGERVHRFDDLGCALAWLDQHPSAAGARPAELWVRHLEGERWLDAFSAAYRAGRKSPMGYGFGALADPGTHAGADAVPVAGASAGADAARVAGAGAGAGMDAGMGTGAGASDEVLTFQAVRERIRKVEHERRHPGHAR